MARIGLLTFHHLPNCGACLQCWALVQVLRQHGFEVSVINYQPPRLEEKYRRSGIRSLMPSIGRMRFNRFIRSQLPLTSLLRQRNEVVEHVARAGYDALVCGSDQIWTIGGSWGCDTTYFLDVCPVKGPRRISYAPSCGNISSFGTNDETIRCILDGFHSISVRDCNTAAIVEKLGIPNVARVVDPTLLADFSSLLNSRGRRRPYIAVVGPANEAAGRLVAEVRQRLKMPAIAFATRCSAADIQQPFVGPTGWLSGIAHADFVISSLFHGVALSVAFRKRFVATDAAGRSFKVADLLNEINLGEQLLYLNNGEYLLPEGVLDMSYRRAEAIISSSIDRSLAFLSSSMRGLAQPSDVLGSRSS